MTRRSNDGTSSRLQALAVAQAVAIAIGSRACLSPALAADSTAGPAAGQSPILLPEMTVEEDKPNPYSAEKLTSPKFTRPLLDTPQSIQVLPEALLEEQGALSMRDVLKNVPGVSITAGEGNPGAGDSLKIRGFNARDDVFIDYGRDVGTYYRDPFFVESVEVVKGPSSTQIGRGSTGGSINLVSKTAKLDRFMDVMQSFGTDETKRTTIDANSSLEMIGLENSAFRLNIMGQDSDVAGRDEVHNSRYGIAPSLKFGIGTPTRLTLNYLHLYQDNLPDYGIPTVRDPAFTGSRFAGKVAPVNFDNFYGYTERDHENIDMNSWTANLEHDFNKTFSVRNQLRYQSVGNESAYSAPRINAPMGCAPNCEIDANTTYRGDGKFHDERMSLLDNQTDLTSHFNTGFIGHTLVTGIEAGYQRLANKRRLDQRGPNGNLFDPDPDVNLTLTQLGVYLGQNVVVNSDFVSYYLLDTLKLSERWFLSGGFRWDYVRTELSSFDRGMYPGFEINRARSDSVFSRNGALTFKPLPNGSIYFGYGTSFDPLASQFTANRTIINPFGTSNGLPDLPPDSYCAPGVTPCMPVQGAFDAGPEETETYELGTKWDFLRGRLSFTSALFRTVKSNVLDADPVNPNQLSNVGGSLMIQGFELGLTGAITDAWNVQMGYTFLDSEILKSNRRDLPEGSRVDNTPESTFNVWTTYALPWNVTVGLGAQYVDKRTNIANVDDFTFPVSVDSYWRYDAMLAYKLNKRFKFRVNLYNLADKRYIEQLGAGQAIPGPARSALFTAEMSL